MANLQIYLSSFIISHQSQNMQDIYFLYVYILYIMRYIQLFVLSFVVIMIRINNSNRYNYRPYIHQNSITLVTLWTLVDNKLAWFTLSYHSCFNFKVANQSHVDAVARLESFWALKLSGFESCRALKLSAFESIRALKISGFESFRAPKLSNLANFVMTL